MINSIPQKNNIFDTMDNRILLSRMPVANNLQQTKNSKTNGYKGLIIGTTAITILVALAFIRKKN